MALRKATRQRVKLRLGLAGPSGSGKTYSALLLASGMADWNKIAIIDTENGSADLYSHLGSYSVITLTSFSPDKYIAAIKECENAGMEVIIIDSITHEWDGKDGCLETVDKITQASRSKNSYVAWSEVTPRHTAFIQAILQSKCHVITTVRKKQDYDMVKGVDGKTNVVKVGLKEITREGFEYELTVNFELDMTHRAVAGKDRTEIFMDKPPFEMNSEVGEQLLGWCQTGVVATEPEVEKTEEQKLKETEFGGGKNTLKDEAVSRFVKAFNNLCEVEKWTNVIAEKNWNAVTGGQEVDTLNLQTLITYAQSMEKKIEESTLTQTNEVQKTSRTKQVSKRK